MPNKKETAAEKAARFQKASSELALRAELQTCYQVMKTNGAAVQAVHKCLTSLGYLSSDGKIAASPPSTNSGSSTPASTKTPKSDSKKQLNDLFDMSSVPPASPKHASVEALQFILAKLEPASLSQHALRGCLRGAQRKLPKTLVMELLVFVVDADEDSDWSQTGSWAFLLEQLADINEANGRRARDIIMPVTWSTSGIYKLEMIGGGLWLFNRFSGLRAQVSDPRFRDVDSVSQVTVTKNFSVRMATISRLGRMVNLPCFEVLPPSVGGGGGGQGGSAREQLALTNGQLAIEAPVIAPAGNAGAQAAPAPPAAAGAPPCDELFQTPPLKRRRSFESHNGADGVQEVAPGASGSSSSAPLVQAEPTAPAPAQPDDDEANFRIN